eukprot:3746576-Pyramimonas_sp.AAC.1
MASSTVRLAVRKGDEESNCGSPVSLALTSKTCSCIAVGSGSEGGTVRESGIGNQVWHGMVWYGMVLTFGFDIDVEPLLCHSTTGEFDSPLKYGARGKVETRNPKK